MLAAGPLRIGSLAVEVAGVHHGAGSLAFRISSGDGPGLVYSGDCGRATDLDPLVRSGDVLLCEVSFGPGPVPPDAAHLDGPTVAALATRTGASRILLTHLLMGFDEAATIASVSAGFDGPVALVAPGDRIDLNS